jgi:hypothetical protein
MSKRSVRPGNYPTVTEDEDRPWGQAWGKPQGSPVTPSTVAAFVLGALIAGGDVVSLFLFGLGCSAGENQTPEQHTAVCGGQWPPIVSIVLLGAGAALLTRQSRDPRLLAVLLVVAAGLGVSPWATGVPTGDVLAPPQDEER